MDRRIRIALARVETAAIAWHHLVDCPDRAASERVVAELHAACVALSAATRESLEQGAS